MKLHRDLDIRQGTAWHMLHRIREGMMPEIIEVFEGPIEVDETYIGGKDSISMRTRNSTPEAVQLAR